MHKEYGKSVYKCRCITGGSASGEVLISNDPICFYLTDPHTGIVIERNHQLEGKNIAGKILLVKSGKGSSVVQIDGLYYLKQKNNLPAAIIVKDVEPVIVSAAVVIGLPLVDIPCFDPFKIMQYGDFVEINTELSELTVFENHRTNL